MYLEETVNKILENTCLIKKMKIKIITLNISQISSLLSFACTCIIEIISIYALLKRRMPSTHREVMIGNLLTNFSEHGLISCSTHIQIEYFIN